MRIDFFEEYPTEENLAKARSFDFVSTIYIAARSHAEFESSALLLKGINPKLEAAYWPVLPHSYWVSPFAAPDDLDALAVEVGRMQAGQTVLLDLELPLLRKAAFLRNARHFFSNRGRIRRIFALAQKRGVAVRTAEYPAPNTLIRSLFRALGVSYRPDEHFHEKIVMMYSSMIKSRVLGSLIRSHVTKEARGGRLHVGLGTIATGVLGSEPILSPDGLSRDLEFAERSGAVSAVIFRLGGLTNEHMSVVRRHGIL